MLLLVISASINAIITFRYSHSCSYCVYYPPPAYEVINILDYNLNPYAILNNPWLLDLTIVTCGLHWDMYISFGAKAMIELTN
jgi:hypothetical protein